MNVTAELQTSPANLFPGNWRYRKPSIRDGNENAPRLIEGACYYDHFLAKYSLHITHIVLLKLQHTICLSCLGHHSEHCGYQHLQVKGVTNLNMLPA